MVKATIKRAQNDARISFAERERLRPKGNAQFFKRTLVHQVREKASEMRFFCTFLGVFECQNWFIFPYLELWHSVCLRIVGIASV